MKYLLTVLMCLPVSASAAKAVMEGIRATRDVVVVDTANARLDLSTNSYNGNATSVGLYTSSNAVFSDTNADKCVIFATGSVSCLGSNLTSGAGGSFVLRAGDSMTGSLGIFNASPVTRFDLQGPDRQTGVAANAAQTITQQGNALKWQYTNSTTFRGSLGVDAFTGNPFIGFHAEYSTSAPTATDNYKNDGRPLRGMVLRYSDSDLSLLSNGNSNADGNFTAITNVISFLPAGRVGILTTTPCSTCTLHVAGGIASNGTIQAATLRWDDGTTQTTAAGVNIISSSTLTMGAGATTAGFQGCTSSLTLTTNGKRVSVIHSGSIGSISNTQVALWILQDGSFFDGENGSTGMMSGIITAGANTSMTVSHRIETAPSAASHTYCIGASSNGGVLTWPGTAGAAASIAQFRVETQ